MTRTGWLLTAALGLIVTTIGLATSSMVADAQRAEDPWLDGFIPPPTWGPSQPRPPSHDADFLSSHGARLAAGDAADCASCHTEQSCTDCHDGLVAPVSVHPIGWRVVHGFEATNDATSCTSCHTATRFCSSCHIESDLVSLPTRPAPPTLQAHPPGWMTPGSATHHGDEARANLMSCATCHTGASCATCHATVNPHGAGFADRCRRMLDAGAPTCARCHDGVSAIGVNQLAGHPGCRR
jgi:hypothetical protein